MVSCDVSSNWRLARSALVDLVGERVREPLPEVVGRVELVDRSVDLNEKSSKLLALAAASSLIAYSIIAWRRRVVAPAVGDHRGDVFSQRRADRLGVRAIFPQMNVEIS